MKKPTSYETLLKNYSRDRRQGHRVQCDCGKMVYANQQEKHRQTKMHQHLKQKLQEYHEFVENEKQRKQMKMQEIQSQIQQLQKELQTIDVSSLGQKEFH